MNQTKPQIKSNIIWRQVDENTVVVTPQSGKMRVLNGVGSTIWQLLAAGHSSAAIVEHLVAQYEVSAGQARTDLDRFLADLTERNLIHWAA
jgi:hypothetical protein